MDYIREAKNYLFYYRNLYRSIENLDREIMRVLGKNWPKDVKAAPMDFERVSGGGGGEDSLNAAFKVQALTKSKRETLQKLQEIDEIMEGMDQVDKQVLYRCYIENVPAYIVAGELGYTERHLRRIKERALKRFAVQLFGLNAVDVM